MQIDHNLRAVILQARGPNQDLAKEVVEKLSPDAKRRLLQILEDLKSDALNEQRKRRRGQFW